MKAHLNLDHVVADDDGGNDVCDDDGEALDIDRRHRRQHHCWLAQKMTKHRMMM